MLLNDAQLAACKTWAADDRLWTTQETVEINLATFARTIKSFGGEIMDRQKAVDAVDRIYAYIRGIGAEFLSDTDNPYSDLALIRAALSGSDGFVMVPREPTEEMIKAHETVCWDTHYCHGTKQQAKAAYRAMIAAATQDKGEDK